jgi:tripartite-type tricarboxylate transporter receptor subunit TctC
MGPKGIPEEVVSKIHAALVAEIEKPEIKQFLDGIGVIPVGSTPEAFAKRLRDMAAHWAALSPRLGLEKQ